jgi:DNA primase
VLAFDADRAGANATIRAGKIALALGMDVKVIDMPDKVDPADLISKMGADAWRESVKKSKHIIEYLLDSVLKKNSGDARKAGREIKEIILPFVNALPSSIEKMYFIKKISELSAIPLSALEDDLKKIEQALKDEKEEIIEEKESSFKIYRKDYIERKLLGIILWQRSLKKVGKKQSVNTDTMIKEMEDILGISQEELLEKTKDNEGDLIFEAEVFYDEGSDLKKDSEEMLSNFKEEYVKEKLERKMRELHDAENVKDAERSAEILKECQILNSEIQKIKNGRLKH